MSAVTKDDRQNETPRKPQLPVFALLCLIITVALGWRLFQKQAVSSDAPQMLGPILQVPPALLLSGKAATIESLGTPTDDDLKKWERKVAAAPTDPIVLNNFGALLLAAKRPADALPLLAKASAITPDNPTISYNYGRALYQHGSLGESLRLVQFVADSDKKCEQAHVLLALLDVATKDFGGAEEEIRKVGANTRPDVMCLRGALALAAGRKDQAIVILRRASLLFPIDPTVWYDLGVAYQQSNDLAQAKQCYQETIRIAPTFLKAHHNLGTIFASVGANGAAAREFELAGPSDIAPSSGVRRPVLH